ncbi:MAG: hypothetical protein KDE02_15255 [Rhodobacteraceae bacterium]|nr:hypothetical protein [Paracoccaceae bacterium]MCP5324031.1 hypothetical protein [Paracoccaceae bacterium]
MLTGATSESLPRNQINEIISVFKKICCTRAAQIVQIQVEVPERADEALRLI